MGSSLGDERRSRAYDGSVMSTTTTRAISIMCSWPACGERNRPEAVFCAQCGRVLEPVGPGFGDGFVCSAPSNHRADHLGEMLCWGMAAAGIMILSATFLRMIGRIVG